MKMMRHVIGLMVPVVAYQGGRDGIVSYRVRKEHMGCIVEKHASAKMKLIATDLMGRACVFLVGQGGFVSSLVYLEYMA